MRIVVVVIMVSLGSCGIIRTEYTDGSVRMRVYLSSTGPPLCGEGGAIAFTLTTLGAWGSRAGAGLGYQRTRQICLPAECRVVVLAELAETADAWRRVLANVGDVCVLR